MEKSAVYFSDMRAGDGKNLLQKLEHLMRAAGIDKIDFEKQFTAIKLHFGEPGNLAYLRPNYAKVVSDVVKGLGGLPFVTDCNTLYVGRRKNGLDHMDAAYENGYNPFALGCHTVIADGIKGTDEAIVKVLDGEYVKNAKIGQAIMDADIFISLNHFKCHEITGIGGALKNIGMGCGSRAGKMEMHASGKPMVDKELCTSCGQCAKQCAHSAISFEEKKAVIDHSRCAGCGRCIGTCRFDAVHSGTDEAFDILDKKIAEYSAAVLRGRPHFHISLVIDVSPFCDCHSENDRAIVSDIGMLCSFDPVALDQACADLVNSAPPAGDSRLFEQLKKQGEDNHSHRDHFSVVHPTTNWEVCLDHAVKLGLGSREYKLITV